jgi:adenosylcobinamide-phosphate synthase
MIQVAIAVFLDLIVGDPRWLPHPVVLIGKCIRGLESLLRKLFFVPFPANGSPAHSDSTAVRERWAGILLVVLIVGGSGSLVAGILLLAYKIHPLVAAALNIWLISTTIAVKGLADAGTKIRKELEQGNLQEARKLAGWIVSRDTSKLPEPEVARAAVESVSENIVDAAVSPMFYALLGGAPLAMAYRAANTLDSMVGYKNEKYFYFGWASARFDDLLNWLPARITGVLIVVSAWLLRFNAGRALKTIRRDAKKHPSPNSGIPEAGVAGALGIRLGGINIYHGRESFRAYMGEPLNSISPQHIRQTVQILYSCTLLFLLFGGLLEFSK